MCNVRCKDEKELVAHIKSDHEKVAHKCKTCNFEADTRNIMKKHVDDVHGSIEVVIEGTQKNCYKCDQCEFQIDEKEILRAHAQKHSERVTIGSFNCTECQYIGIRKDSLEQHVRMKHINKDISPMNICDFCAYESVSEINLRQHEIDVHKITKLKSQERNQKTEKDQAQNFPCDVCPYVAHTDKELSNHLEEEHSFSKVSRRKIYTNEERKNNGICFHWNNGYCHFLELCKFAHEQIPQCHYDVNCQRQNCQRTHGFRR